MKLFIEKNFENIIKVWIIICVGARIFFKDIYVLYIHIIGILFYILYCYKKNRKIKDINVYWVLIEITSLLEVIQSIIKCS